MQDSNPTRRDLDLSVFAAQDQQFDLRQIEERTWREGSRVRFYMPVVFAAFLPPLIVLVALFGRRTPLDFEGVLVGAAVTGLAEALAIDSALAYSHGPISATLTPNTLTLYSIGHRASVYRFDSPRMRLELQFDDHPQLGPRQYSIVGRRPRRSYITAQLNSAIVDTAIQRGCGVSRGTTWYGVSFVRIRGHNS